MSTSSDSGDSKSFSEVHQTRFQSLELKNPTGSVIEELVVRVGKPEYESNRDQQLKDFLAASDWHEKLRIWFGDEWLRKWLHEPRNVIRHLDRDLAFLNKAISEQLSEVLHAPEFQRLEGSWRGLHHLVQCRDRALEKASKIKISVWSVKRTELKNDLDGANEFDQSNFFKKVYEEGIGTPGADPFSVLLIDFELHPLPNKEHKFDDISILRKMSETAAAAFAPLFINAHPSMFGVEAFSEFRQSLDVESLHDKRDFMFWRNFRDKPEARFVSVVLPRMLMRRPYRPEWQQNFGFPYEENPKNSNEYVWGGAVWGVGEVLIRAFNEYGWFANIRGIEQGAVTGGVVLGPSQDPFFTEPDGVATKPITEIMIADHMERQLAALGFMPLCPTKYGSEGAFYSTPSAQKPKRFSPLDATANANAELSAQMNYILCASRFAHYVKYITRDWLGTFNDPSTIQSKLSDWVRGYVNPDPEANLRIRAEKPLLEANIQVTEKFASPGEYDCIIELVPYHGFDDVRASLRLDTRLISKKG